MPPRPTVDLTAWPLLLRLAFLAWARANARRPRRLFCVFDCATLEWRLEE